MAFKLLRRKKVLAARVFTIEQERWRGPRGTTFDRTTIAHPGAVAILPFDARGRVLMIKQFRPAVRRWLLEIPAGTLEKGERPLYCAKRELIEETGFAARNWKKLGAIFTAPGFCSEKIVIFKASGLKPSYAEQDEDEYIAPAAMTMQEIRKAVRSGRICDAKTLAALLYLGWIR